MLKNTWSNGIAAACFLVLSYLFETDGARISGVMFLILALVFGFEAFVKNKKAL